MSQPRVMDHDVGDYDWEQHHVTFGTTVGDQADVADQTYK